jgi:hypothetical protein
VQILCRQFRWGKAILRPCLALRTLQCGDLAVAGGTEQLEVGLMVRATGAITRTNEWLDVVDLNATLTAVDATAQTSSAGRGAGAWPKVLSLKSATALVRAVHGAPTRRHHLVAPLAAARVSGPSRERANEPHLLHAEHATSLTKKLTELRAPVLRACVAR